MQNKGSAMHASLRWLTQHFRRYRKRTPWDFCLRISLEGLVVSVAFAIFLESLGVAERVLPPIGRWALFSLAVLVAPVAETLCFQAIPIGLARMFHARLGWQVVWSTAAFLVVHSFEGLGAGLCAGLIGGFYFAFTYAHWREHSRWTAFWTTATSHALVNALAILLAIASGEI
jgi:hypothetical protein